jgi:hypothetical protein
MPKALTSLVNEAEGRVDRADARMSIQDVNLVGNCVGLEREIVSIQCSDVFATD